MRTLSALRRTAIVLMTLIGSYMNAQTAITSDDLLGLIGTTQIIESTANDNLNINLGSPGENQIWDFTALSFPADEVQLNYIIPDGTPFEEDFPTANLTIAQIDSTDEDFDKLHFYQYLEVSSDEFAQLGLGVVIPEIDSSFVLVLSEELAPLPLTYNTTWMSTSMETFGDPDSFAFVSTDTTINLVDGWGTLILPIGSFDCLRVRADNTFTDRTYVNGQIIQEFSGTSFTYSWVSAEHFLLAEAESEENENDPNFNVAAYFFWLTSSTTGIEDAGEANHLPGNFSLEQNYPNPFNPSTEFKFHIADFGFVQLDIYDIQGKLVKSIINRNMNPGEYTGRWDGTSDAGRPVASGVYLYRLAAADFLETRKMVLLR